MNKAEILNCCAYKIFNASSTPSLVLLPDYPTFTILAVNSAFLDNISIQKDKLLDKGIMETFYNRPSDKLANGSSSLLNSISSAFKKKSIDVMPVQEFDLTLLNDTPRVGKKIWQIKHIPILSNQDIIQFIIHKVIDKTEKVNAELAMQEAEIKSRFHFENNPYPMIIWDFETLDIVDVNQQSIDKYGYTREEFLKLNITQIRPAEDIPLIKLATKDVEHYGKTHSRTWRHLKKNGEGMFMEVNSHLATINGRLVSINHNQDVTERLMAEQYLRESEKRYSSLFYHGPNPKFIYDKETLRYIHVNKAAIDTYGYTEEEFLNMTVLDIRPQEDAKNVVAFVNNAVHTTGEYSGRVQHYKKSKEIMDVETYTNTISFNNKDYILAVAIDVTERIKQIKTIEDQNRTLREIAWTQSHLVRAPLANLMGLIDVMKNDRFSENKKKDVLEAITASANKLDEIIREISMKAYQV